MTEPLAGESATGGLAITGGTVVALDPPAVERRDVLLGAEPRLLADFLFKKGHNADADGGDIHLAAGRDMLIGGSGLGRRERHKQRGHDLSRQEGRVPRPFKELIQRQSAFPLQTDQVRFGLHGHEGRGVIGRRGGVAKISSNRAHIAHFNVRHDLNRVSKGGIVLQDIGMGRDFGKPRRRSYGQTFFGAKMNLAQTFNFLQRDNCLRL